MRIAVIHVKYLEAPDDANVQSENFSEANALAHIRTNLELNYSMLRKAGEQKADLGVTNEDFGDYGRYIKNQRFPRLFASLATKLEEEVFSTISGIAKQYGMNIAYNEYRTDNGLIYNTSTFIDRNGKQAGWQHKVHLPAGERLKSAEGAGPLVIKTDIGTVGFCICYDMIFPEYCRALALLGADIIIHQTQGWGFGGAPARQAGEGIVRTRAFENSVYFIVAKNIQNEGGMSCVLDNYGDFLGAAEGREDQLLVTDVTPDFMAIDKYDLGNYFAGVESIRARKFLARRPETYGLLSDPNPPVLEYFPGIRFANENELDARVRALSELEKNNPDERKKYHWHPKL